jgi:hypothetical protein
MHMRSRIAGRVAAAAVMLAGLAAPAWSQEVRPPFDIEGGYVGFAGLLDFTLDGKTFDGETVYKEIDGEELLLLPRLRSRTLPKFVFGFRTAKGALEFSYERGRHDATFFEFPVGAVFNCINVDGRFFFLKHQRFQPHLVLGAAFPWLTIDDGSASSDQPDAEVGDARWRGLAANTEVGLTVFATPQAGVSIGYAYRWMYFSRATGVSDRLFELHPSFRETSGNLVVMGFFTFKSK